MEPILIYKNESAIKNEKAQMQLTQKFWQNIVDKYNDIGLGEDKNLTGNDLVLFVANPKSFIVDKVTQGENLTIGSMAINKNKAFEILELPAQLYQIINEVENIKLGHHTSNFLIRNQTTNFIVNNGIVEFTENYIQYIEKMHSIFIVTSEQKKAWELMQEIATKMNDLRSITSNKGYTLYIEDMKLFFGFSERKDSKCVNKANPKVIELLN